MIDNHPSEYAILGIHHADDWATPWGDERKIFYNPIFDGYPYFVVDGLADAWPISNYQAAFQIRHAVPTDMLITVTGDQVDEDTWDVTAEVCIESGGSGKTVRAYMVEVLDQYPPPPSHFNRNVRQGPPGTDVTVVPGDCTSVVNQFTFDGESMSHPADIEIVAWAQDAFDQGPAEVHQAAKYRPFLVLGDGFESGDTSGWTITVP